MYTRRAVDVDKIRSTLDDHKNRAKCSMRINQDVHEKSVRSFVNACSELYCFSQIKVLQAKDQFY